ncbi:glycosyl hydrolases family 2 domain-containing protein [Hirsutella rhossiliensis]|uniref:Glycosyl hydrolases family 2 domain-containing protein n=1 Tax=Hirsutella rhossiliensis TaxID=111463 RepID=A0A9P8SBV3_9HYPO|nr:glycosyl hydrolases family 2 domain-containing protein [Hirsutella rhossiliensis]KAH0956943.1 glycosyl hydrolases family 2 domain-containing protein [Hirsutella rhossiliensis]
MQLLHAVLWSSLFWLSVAAGSLQSVFKRAPVPYRVQTPPLDTDWTYKVGRDPWPEHPRPQLRRDVWQNLNGIWTYQEARSAADIDKLPGGLLEREVLVPSSFEFQRNGKEVGHLHFEAVDYDATVFVNGVKVGNHVGGYFRFSLDVTAQVKFDEDNELLVFVERSRDHIQQLDVAAGMDGIVTLTAHRHVVARRRGNADTELQFEVDNPELWEPSSPTLYNMTIKMGEDEVQSYTGFRTISKGLVNGIQRPLLNGDFVFLFGTLDQGYWPDGLYTPPSREAMIYDLKMLKSLGFNMVRKVEPDLLIKHQKEFQRQLEVLISEHKSYPSIVTWVIYNEGWGQRRNAPYPEGQLTDVVRSIDPTRLIDSVTGWFDHGFGTFPITTITRIPRHAILFHCIFPV